MRLLPLLLLFAFAGCQPQSVSPPPPSIGRTPTAPVSHGTDPWKLVWTDPSVNTPAVLWNGLIGVRIGRSGAGLDNADLPLPAFKIDGYDLATENIEQEPNPLVVLWELDGKRLSMKDAKDYRQELDMKTGLLTTSYSTPEAKFECLTAIHPHERIIAQKWTVTASKDVPFRLESIAVSPTIAPKNVEGTAKNAILSYSFLDRIRLGHEITGIIAEPRHTGKGFMWEGTLIAGKPVALDRCATVGKRAAIALITDPSSPKSYGRAPLLQSFDEVRRASEKAWRARSQTDIEIDGPVEDQQAVRSFLFYLRSAIHPDGDMAISPMGLSSTTYNGHVFWDADIWVFPALALIDPVRAKEISEYRLSRLTTAESNYTAWLKADRPIASGTLGSYRHGSDDNGAMFPWESSITGKETVPGPSKWEHHITGSVAFTLAQANALDLVDDKRAASALVSAALFYLARTTISGKPEKAEIKGVMSPDEHHIGDNDLYTNLLATWAWRIGTMYAQTPPASGVPSGWWFPDGREMKVGGLELPKDETSFLTYDNDTVRGYKQAAAVLAIYPLQYPEAEKQAKVMMDRFADKVTKNGPAMTDSVHALIWARLGETDKAYAEWQKSWKDFTNHPLLLFSEKRSKDETYFTTGAGGCLQTVLYGFLGFRIDSKKDPEASWATKLHGDSWLTLKPHLPKEWKKVVFKNFTVLGKRYTLTATHDGVTVTKGDS